jgi:hypothetical protein
MGRLPQPLQDNGRYRGRELVSRAQRRYRQRHPRLRSFKTNQGYSASQRFCISAAWSSVPWWMRSVLRNVMREGPIRHEALINEQLDSKDIFERFFADRPRPQFYSKCISSRHFDAARTKTCQIMFRGRFNDIFRANEHYLALEPDFSNIDELLATFIPWRTNPIDTRRSWCCYPQVKHRRCGQMCAVQTCIIRRS